METIQTIIIKNLIYNEEFSRKVLPFIKEEYFSEQIEKILFNKISDFILKFNSLPTKEALIIECSNDSKIPEKVYSDLTEYFDKLTNNQEKNSDLVWLITQTEKFCQEKAIYNAVVESVSILDDSSGKKTKGIIPKLLQDALSVSFDPNIGHNYIEDFQKRYDYYHTIEKKIPFDLKFLNKITKGGVSKKTLNIILAGTAVGKSLAMCHMAGACLLNGKNVLYITLEMAEERIAERIDANLLNISLNDLQNIPKDLFQKKIETLTKKTTGKLIVKEYPTATANVNHFRALLQELYLKRSFSPDIIFIDYLNIATSSRINHGTHSANTYVYVKNIAEEFRGLAVEYDVPIWSATQTTRGGYNSSDPGLEDTSESFGLPATADFMIALTSSEELEKLGQIMIKQLKNRYNDVNTYKRFVVGIDRSKMRLFDVEDSAQNDIADPGSKDEDKPIFDNTKFGTGMKAERPAFDDFIF